MHDGRKVGGRTVTYILLGSFTRKVGYDKPHSGDVAPEFLEFYWGNWLRGGRCRWQLSILMSAAVIGRQLRQRLA